MVTYSIYRRTRSARLTVTTPEGTTINVDNLVGDSGFSLEFEARRTMDDTLGEFSVTAYNLPAEARAIMESAQVRRVDDIDQLLSGLNLQTSAVDSSGAQALEAGFLVVELSAGYDGTMSRVFRAIGTRCKSGYGGGDQGRDSRGRYTEKVEGLTYRTTIDAMDAMDGVLLGVPLRSFPAQSTIYELVDYLRQLAGLELGNLSYPLLTALIGDAKLSSPYHVAGGQALAHLRNVLQWLPLRWFVDDRALWICGRDDVPNFNNVPAYVAGDVAEPDLLLSRPQRDDGGRVRIECLLCPRILPGHLVNLTPGGLALALQGLSPTDQQIAYAQVPPGFYRCEEVSHTGSTSDMDRWTTTALLRPGVAQDIVVL
jgi:hypothetical protein